MSINLVWLKRDIRLADHLPLQQAIVDSIKERKSLILIYIFEGLLLDDPHYTTRYWRFVYQSLVDLANHIPQKALWIARGNALDVIADIHQRFKINNIYSHQEIGLKNTYNRDKQVYTWCQKNHVFWYQSQLGAVQRGLKNRVN